MTPLKHWGAIALGLGLALAACEKQPAPQVRERIDRAAMARNGSKAVDRADPAQPESGRPRN